MSNNAKIIWDYFKAKGFNDYGIAGLMGNLYAESGLIPTNLQNTYEKKFKMTDAEYTTAVDNGTYTNFSDDGAGYGIAQWTSAPRKLALLIFCKDKHKSIGDLYAQLDFLYKELITDFPQLLKILTSTTSISEASNAILFQFERPAKQDLSVQETRQRYSQVYYDKYAEKEVQSIMNSNSPLITYINISPNKNSPRNHKIDTITIHCIVGQWTAKQGCDYFAQKKAKASPNYVVGKDGSIGLSVDEGDRSWCTSSSSNDNRAVTIEVASDRTDPYAVTDEAYNALILLVADICKRNDIKELKWKADKRLIGKIDQQNMTVHRWFANKACPGEYLYSRHGDIATKVNALLQQEDDEDMTQEKFNEMMNTYLSNQRNLPATFEQDALVWGQKNSLMVGDQSGRLMAKKFMTRGEFIVVLKRFYDKFIKK